MNLEKILFFQADDHYAHVYYDSDAHFMIPVGLSCVEECINEQCRENHFLVRIGRKYIVNLNKVFHINVFKQEASLRGLHGKFHVLHVSKPALRELMHIVKH